MADPATDGPPLLTEPQVRWKVATIAHDGTALWRIQPAEFKERALAEEWAHYILWAPAPSTQRPRNAALLRVVDGAVQVPGWMRVHPESEVEGRESEEEPG